MLELSPAVVGIAVPVMFLICAVAIVITAIIVNGGQKELRHRERILAMEKGLDLPKDPPKKKRPAYLTMRAWGLVFSFISIALLVGLIPEAGFRHGMWGLMPGGLGAGLLIAAYLEQKDKSE
ncbi:MAG: hypothetical protein JW814_10895 [Candidatus Krumholzibacteriota bacterium]|nr:hypothetical protein [Candidatus Krumholzibacteriota bacterium]